MREKDGPGRIRTHDLSMCALPLFCQSQNSKNINTSLPLTSTRRFDQHIQAFPLSEKCRQLLSATSRIVLQYKFLAMQRIKPRAAGWEVQMLPLCYPPPPPKFSFFGRPKNQANLYLMKVTDFHCFPAHQKMFVCFSWKVTFCFDSWCWWCREMLLRLQRNIKMMRSEFFFISSFPLFSEKNDKSQKIEEVAERERERKKRLGRE